MSTWYPFLCPDGMWQPRTKSGEAVPLFFETAGAVMAYLHRSGLQPRPGVKLDMVKHLPADEVRAFMDAWTTRSHKQVIMPPPTEMSPAGPDDDDRWEWIDTATVADAGPVWIKGQCRHTAPEPVDAYPTGELVAWLCPDCGDTFEPDRWPCPEGMWRRIPERFMNSPMTVRKTGGQLVFEVQKSPVGERVWSGFVSVWEGLKRDHWFDVTMIALLTVGMVVIGLVNGWS